MIFTIINKENKEIVIDSNVVPCCNSGHGESKCVLMFEDNLICSRCYDVRRFNGVFWWNLITDDEQKI